MVLGDFLYYILVFYWGILCFIFKVCYLLSVGIWMKKKFGYLFVYRLYGFSGWLFYFFVELILKDFSVRGSLELCLDKVCGGRR